MKKILVCLIGAVILSSCDIEHFDYRIKVYYQNGNSEVLTVTHAGEMTEITTHGCLHVQWVGQIACGVQRYEILSKTTYQQK